MTASFADATRIGYLSSIIDSMSDFRLAVLPWLPPGSDKPSVILLDQFSHASSLTLSTDDEVNVMLGRRPLSVLQTQQSTGLIEIRPCCIHVTK